jgi:ribonuclease HI
MTEKRKQETSKQKTNRKPNNITFLEDDITRWMDNTTYSDTEEIFNFLTEERNKFLTEHNSITNHTEVDSLHNNTSPSTLNSFTILLDKEKQPTHMLSTSINPHQSESRDQEVISEADSEQNTFSTPRDREPTSRIIIASHNIRGITRITDQTIILEEIYQRNFGILGLSETKLTISNQNFAFKDNDHYQCFSSAGQAKPYGSGVLLLIRKDIGKYIESVEKIPGFMVAVNLLSRRRKTFICQIYLPCHKKESLQIQEELKKILGIKRKEKYSIILMGDFNAVVNPKRDRSIRDHQFTPNEEPEIPLFDYLLDNSFLDIQEIWEEENTSYTWRNNTSSSRIDYIWSTREIVAETTRFQNKYDQSISESDHTILALTIQLKSIIHKEKESPDQLRSKSHKFKTISLEETREDQWKDFKCKLDEKLKKRQLKTQILDAQANQEENPEEKIGYLWNTFENLLIRAAFNHLHCRTHKKRTCPKDIVHRKRQNSGFHEFNNFFRACKIRRKWNKMVNNQEQYIQEEMWKELIWLQERTGLIDDIPEPQSRGSKVITQEELLRKKSQVQKATQLLKKLSYQEEKRKQNEAIKKALQKRCEDLKTNQRRVIQTLTNSFRDRIIIDRIKVHHQNAETYITTHREEMFHQIYQYYKEAFKEREAGIEHLNDSWKEQYTPREYIEEDWFNSLDRRIEEEELTAILKNLPNNKAAGPSGIKYEMLKNLGREGISVLTELFNLFLIKGITPRSWKESLLYPISKGREWKCELNNTRPIVLLEVTRKCFTKILTERLGGICKEKNILKGPNFAGLPGESTMEPIHLLNNICEEAREEGKELWILFQDTAKAYDTISLDMLKRALERIKIPLKIIDLILEPFRERRFSVITSIGTTQPITAEDGIDQGETISPLLWRIFYDPLLCKIQENTRKGYNMKCEWNQNLSNCDGNESQLKIRQAAIAYMDDTTWIARSKKDMDGILDEARIFYKANDSQVNGEKSILITINNKNLEPATVEVGPNREKVVELDRSSHARFLGVWIGNKNQKRDAAKRALEEISAIYNVLHSKWMTEKQAEYIINRVLIPRIEYRVQHSEMSWNTCNSLTKRIRKLVRNKAAIVSTLPNSAVHHKGIYNIQKIWNVLKESQVSCLVARLNNTGPAGISTWIRLKQAQISNWEPRNILVDPLPKDFNTKGNLSASILRLANTLDITFRSSQWTEKFEWKGGLITIKAILDNPKEYKRAIPSLRGRRIMYADQVLNKETNTVLSWNLIQLLGGSCKGPKPQWYKDTLRKLTTEIGTLKRQWADLPWQDQNHNFLSQHQETDGRRANWYIVVDRRNPDIFTWIHRKGNVSEPRSNIQSDLSSQHFNLFQNPRSGHAVLRECDYCKNKEGEEAISLQSTIPRTCNLVNRSDSLIWYCDLLNQKQSWRRKMSLEIPVDCRYLEEEIKRQIRESSKFTANLPTDSFLGVEIEDLGVTIIQDNIESEEHKDSLIREYRLNHHQNHQTLDFQFYTDGSLGASLEQEKRMGAAWLQTKGPNQGNFFVTGITDWPSAHRAELAAITLAILTVPQASKVEIVTDSASCISTFDRLIKPDARRTIRRWIKEKNWSLWMRLMEIIRKKKLQIQLTKVKAHSGDPSNEEVDKLAKEGRNFPEVIWKEPRRPLWTVLPMWNQLTVDISLREFVKEVHKKETVIEWSQQNRVQRQWKKEIDEQSNHSWDNFWKCCRQGSSLQTSIKQAKERSFRIKLINDELPTLYNLSKRKPGIYRDSTCPLCGIREENTGHIFECSASRNTRLQIWEEVKKKITSKFQEISDKGNKNNNRQDRPIRLLQLIDQWEEQFSNSSQDLINMCLGLFDNIKKQTWDRKAREDGLRSSASQIILDLLSHKLLKLFRKKVWIPRCEKIIAWEQTQNINRKVKRKKEEPTKKRRGRTDSNSRTPSSQGSQDSQGPQEGRVDTETLGRSDSSTESSPRRKAEENPSLKDKVKEVVWDWIKEGKRWLGF